MKKNKKLSLSKETIANLAKEDMNGVWGGVTQRTYCNQQTCKKTCAPNCTETGIPYCH